MATIISLKRRIQAAQNVSKTTKAMQMIAASKLKKAQDAALSTKPYVEKLIYLTQNVLDKVENPASLHPYLEGNNESERTLVILLAPDKGLAGSLVTNLMREFLRFMHTNKHSYFIIIGKKAERFASLLGDNVIASFPFGTTTPTFDMVYPLSRLINEYYGEKKVDHVKILGMSFTSVFTQFPKMTQVLPITMEELQISEYETNGFYLFEPQAKDILPSLLKHYLEMIIYQQLLESFVSEQASRMIAMQNATTNANDIIEYLRLEYNKTRQAKITSELLDITGAGFAQQV